MSESALSTRETHALRRVRFLAKIMDEAVTIPGTNVGIGLDSVVGLLPVSGDLVTAAISLYAVGEAVRLGADRHVIGRMLFNVAIDFGVGSVPVLGDVFDAVWKSNVRNANLLEKHLNSR
ncbi:DUF4112 domain-containing protein [Halogeometricum borinquense]|uniref:DUF4112 domain-containing protein n=1 Tax=Halogeometricum borinquense TaxID=60847 RepID=A0A6C0UEJ1_9EURY|nr:DUF4112 domain-containing protein [Halogeometricum borinquense]QIB73795.1 DUF4112 domain-containing protein [Halogeometricum borinquense]QIQ76848.1 DUF4112 domain-containing protein [Halogeometricum borinquense]